MDKPMSERMPEYLFSSIHQAMGAASMAWNPVPSTEVFDSNRAADIALELCRDVADWHEAEVATLTTERDRYRGLLAHVRCEGCGSSPADDPTWVWCAAGSSYANGHVLGQPEPYPCGPVSLGALAGTGETPSGATLEGEATG